MDICQLLPLALLKYNEPPILVLTKSLAVVIVDVELILPLMFNEPVVVNDPEIIALPVYGKLDAYATYDAVVAKLEEIAQDDVMA